MNGVHGVFLDLDSLNPGDLNLDGLRDCLNDWQFYDETLPQQLKQHIASAQLVVSNKVVIDRRTLAESPDLKLVCVAATGTDNIDLEAASEFGVVVSNARNYATASVAEHVFSMLLTLARRLDSYRDEVIAGNWSRSPHFCLFGETIEELSGKTMGIVGYGNLGHAVARLAKAFSMKVQIAQRLHGAPAADRIPLDQLLDTSDVISLHCPLTDQTRGLIGERQLRRMKPGAILINTARGGIVDEVVLSTALRERWIAGAALDVLAMEPPAASSPLLAQPTPRLIVTPHIAWASRAARQRLVSEVVENIQAFLRGKPRNQVN